MCRCEFSDHLISFAISFRAAQGERKRGEVVVLSCGSYHRLCINHRSKFDPNHDGVMATANECKFRLVYSRRGSPAGWDRHLFWGSIAAVFHKRSDKGEGSRI